MQEEICIRKQQQLAGGRWCQEDVQVCVVKLLDYGIQAINRYRYSLLLTVL